MYQYAYRTSGKLIHRLVLFHTALLLAVAQLFAELQRVQPSDAEPSKPSPEAVDSKPAPAKKLPASDDDESLIDTKADKLNYDREKGIIEGRGNVVVKKGTQVLKADYVIVDVNTEEASAFGSVILERGTTVWRGTRLKYNFKSGIGDSDAMTYNAKPFNIRAGKVTKNAGRYVLEDAVVTTCGHDFQDAHYTVRSGRIILVPGDHIKCKHSVFFLGPVPIFYLPVWWRSLNDDSGFILRAGYNSRMGAFLLTGYKYPMTSEIRGVTHLDYRSKRGIGIGQDFLWHGGVEGGGQLCLYYIDDKEPLDEHDDPAASGIENARYRLKLKNSSALSERDNLLIQAYYLSDTDVLEDFFEKEYSQDGVQPDNYLVFAHRGDMYSLNLLARGRINDFYSGVNRLPEASITFSRRQIGDSPLYYEGQTAVASLTRVWEESSTEDEYSATRLDSSHMLYWPTRHLGFLNVIPRGGYRATYYSETKGTVASTQLSQVLTTNITVNADGTTNITMTSSTATNSTTSIVGMGAALRSRFEVGAETSFKAFKTWESIGGPRRHVVEPYANYTLVPEPSKTPDELYQFDDVDTLGKEHWITLGIRNKYQKKKDSQPFDLLDVDFYTQLLFERAEDQSLLHNFVLDGRITPSEKTMIRFDGVYDTDASAISTFNVALNTSAEEIWNFGLEYRYTLDTSSLLYGDVTMFPNRSWEFRTYGRFELEESRAEEYGFSVQRNLDCLSFNTGVRMLPGYTRSDGVTVEDEWRVMIEFWIRAFPGMHLSGHHGG